MPDVVRSVVDVPGGEVMTVVEDARTPNEEQLAAIDAGGLVFVSAGAGTGKTTVLVERFVRAVCDRGLPIDSVLAVCWIVSTTCGASASLAAISSFTLGSMLVEYSAPR